MGAYVQEVMPGNSAHAAGMQAKDIIIAVGEHEVTGVNSLSKVLRQFQAGDVTTVTVYRGGQILVLDITLDEKPADLPDTVPVTPQTPETQIPEGNDFEDWYEFFRDYFGNGGK